MQTPGLRRWDIGILPWALPTLCCALTFIRGHHGSTGTALAATCNYMKAQAYSNEPRASWIVGFRLYRGPQLPPWRTQSQPQAWRSACRIPNNTVLSTIFGGGFSKLLGSLILRVPKHGPSLNCGANKPYRTSTTSSCSTWMRGLRRSTPPSVT